MNYKAILWDFGGVVTSSPFEAFNEFESANDLPLDLIRTIILKIQILMLGQNLRVVKLA